MRAQCLDVIYYMFNTALNHPPGTFYAYSNFGCCSSPFSSLRLPPPLLFRSSHSLRSLVSCPFHVFIALAVAPPDLRVARHRYCILGRIIEVVTGKSYEQAVRELLLDPAGVRRSEMYQGATQYQDTRTYEAEYECPGCNLATSVFPNVQEQVPNPYGAWHLEVGLPPRFFVLPPTPPALFSARMLSLSPFSALLPPRPDGTTPPDYAARISHTCAAPGDGCAWRLGRIGTGQRPFAPQTTL